MPTSNLSRSTIAPGSSIIRTLSFVMFLVGWTAVLATVLGFFGTTWWPLDMLSDWRLILAIVLGIAAVATGFGYSRVSTIVFIVAAIVNALLIAPMWLNEQQPLTGSDRVRVISLDIGSTPDAREAIIDWINASEGDIVLLANAGGTWRRYIEVENVPYRVVNDDPGLTGGTPVLARNGISVTLEEVPTILGAVDVIITVPLGNQEVTILGVSVERPVNGIAYSERIDDFAAINARISRNTTPTVIIGNLEASRWSHAFSVIANNMKNSEDGFGYMATYPAYDLPLVAEFAGTPVDHALYVGPITVSHRRVGPNLGTDHRPLLIDVSPASG